MGIISYPRTVGSRAHAQRITHFRRKVRSGHMPLQLAQQFFQSLRLNELVHAEQTQLALTLSELLHAQRVLSLDPNNDMNQGSNEPDAVAYYQLNQGFWACCAFLHSPFNSVFESVHDCDAFFATIDQHYGMKYELALESQFICAADMSMTQEALQVKVRVYIDGLGRIAVLLLSPVPSGQRARILAVISDFLLKAGSEQGALASVDIEQKCRAGLVVFLVCSEKQVRVL